jgi:hypothetical protein
MDEIDVIRALRPKVTVAPEDRVAARSHLDHAIRESRSRVGLPRVWRVVLAAAVVALVFVAGTFWPRTGEERIPPDSAVAIVFPDGSRLTAGEITRAVTDGRTDELRERLARYGINLRIDWSVVHPDAEGRFFGWSFHPAGTSEGRPFDSDWYVDERDAGSLLVVDLGRAPREDEEPTTRGLTLFEVFPKLCTAIFPTDLERTQANLEELGFTPTWSILNGHPDDPDYSGAGAVEQFETPETGVIYTVLADNGSIDDVSPDMQSVMLEVVPVRSESETDGPAMWSGVGCR